MDFKKSRIKLIAHDIYSSSEWDFFYIYVEKCLSRNVSVMQFLYNLNILGYSEKILRFYNKNDLKKYIKCEELDRLFIEIGNVYKIKKKYYDRDVYLSK